MSDEFEPEESDATLAGEYVLGVLDPDEAQAVERRVETDASFAAFVDFWIARFAPLALALPEATPSAATKRRVFERLFGPPARARRPAFSARRYWQAFTTGAAAAALASVLVAGVLFLRPGAPDQAVLAVLSADDAEPPLVIRVTRDRTQADIHAAALATGSGDAQLWLVPPGDNPRSLGLINARGSTRVTIPENLRAQLTPGVTLAVSLEPRGGSPTGQPTGPILASGIVRLL